MDSSVSGVGLISYSEIRDLGTQKQPEATSLESRMNTHTLLRLSAAEICLLRDDFLPRHAHNSPPSTITQFSSHFCRDDCNPMGFLTTGKAGRAVCSDVLRRSAGDLWWHNTPTNSPHTHTHTSRDVEICNSRNWSDNQFLNSRNIECLLKKKKEKKKEKEKQT